MTDPTVRHPRPIHYLDEEARRTGRHPLLRLMAWLTALALGGVVALTAALWAADRTPREWGPYLQRLTATAPAPVAHMVDSVAAWLSQADRLTLSGAPVLPAGLGAAADRSGAVPEGRPRPVTSVEALVDAIASVRPGDVITLLPGHYRLAGATINATAVASPNAPITVRAERLGDAFIESDQPQAFRVSAPFWHFENLVITGVCADHARCEHAISVVGGGSDIVIRNNRLVDFNAQIKINGENESFPDRGVIEGNTLLNTAPRATANPVTPIDLVAANDWHISGNLIADFVRAVPEPATYGAFAKGAGEGTVLERNVVICEWRLRSPGQHVGLSLGGGGTDTDALRDRGRTGFEQVGGILRDNLIVGCSDDGIYLNRAARSVVDHNTLLDTAGVDARFVETSAQVTSNIIDGTVRRRDGATVTGWDNATAWVPGLFLGYHPARGYFRDPAALDLAWRGSPDTTQDAKGRPDLCGKPRGLLSPIGAFADYALCLRPAAGDGVH